MNLDLTKEIVRVLTWKGPYSTLMLPPYKKKETRTYATNVRGFVVIHQAQKGYNDSELLEIAGPSQYKRIHELLAGHVESDEYNGMCIGFANLIECRPMQPEDADDCFVEYNPDLFVWWFDEVRHIKPFPRKGGQGWRILSDEEKKQIVLI